MNYEEMTVDELDKLNSEVLKRQILDVKAERAELMEVRNRKVREAAIGAKIERLKAEAAEAGVPVVVSPLPALLEAKHG